MGINVDDSLRLTKFIQQGTTNSKHRSLAQTNSAPIMTLGKATLLFDTYTPAEPSSSSVSVNAVICYFCRKKGDTAQNCQKKKRHSKRKVINYNQKIKNFHLERQLQRGSGFHVSSVNLLIIHLISVHVELK